ncbi:hypothetical protein K502DRAFT_325687 [Neoconidiobolus thromboides FSU 785]|nr:hypothetical protein K502DRAFT_325687 [Neoconidiobolus thromboides FSU 785]
MSQLALLIQVFMDVLLVLKEDFNPLIPFYVPKILCCLDNYCLSVRKKAFDCVVMISIICPSSNLIPLFCEIIQRNHPFAEYSGLKLLELAICYFDSSILVYHENIIESSLIYGVHCTYFDACKISQLASFCFLKRNPYLGKNLVISMPKKMKLKVNDFKREFPFIPSKYSALFPNGFPTIKNIECLLPGFDNQSNIQKKFTSKSDNFTIEVKTKNDAEAHLTNDRSKNQSHKDSSNTFTSDQPYSNSHRNFNPITPQVSKDQVELEIKKKIILEPKNQELIDSELLKSTNDSNYNLDNVGNSTMDKNFNFTSENGDLDEKSLDSTATPRTILSRIIGSPKFAQFNTTSQSNTAEATIKSKPKASNGKEYLNTDFISQSDYTIPLNQYNNKSTDTYNGRDLYIRENTNQFSSQGRSDSNEEDENESFEALQSENENLDTYVTSDNSDDVSLSENERELEDLNNNIDTLLDITPIKDYCLLTPPSPFKLPDNKKSTKAILFDAKEVAIASKNRDGFLPAPKMQSNPLLCLDPCNEYDQIDKYRKDEHPDSEISLDSEIILNIDKYYEEVKEIKERSKMSGGELDVLQENNDDRQLSIVQYNKRKIDFLESKESTQSSKNCKSVDINKET